MKSLILLLLVSHSLCLFGLKKQAQESPKVLAQVNGPTPNGRQLKQMLAAKSTGQLKKMFAAKAQPAQNFAATRKMNAQSANAADYQQCKSKNGSGSQWAADSIEIAIELGRSTQNIQALVDHFIQTGDHMIDVENLCNSSYESAGNCSDFKVIEDDEAIPQGWQLATWDQVDPNRNQVNSSISGAWQIVRVEDGAISGSGYGYGTKQQDDRTLGHRLIMQCEASSQSAASPSAGITEGFDQMACHNAFYEYAGGYVADGYGLDEICQATGIHKQSVIDYGNDINDSWLPVGTLCDNPTGYWWAHMTPAVAEPVLDHACVDMCNQAGYTEWIWGGHAIGVLIDLGRDPANIQALVDGFTNMDGQQSSIYVEQLCSDPAFTNPPASPTTWTSPASFDPEFCHKVMNAFGWDASHFTANLGISEGFHHTKFAVGGETGNLAVIIHLLGFDKQSVIDYVADIKSGILPANVICDNPTGYWWDHPIEAETCNGALGIVNYLDATASNGNPEKKQAAKNSRVIQTKETKLARDFMKKTLVEEKAQMFKK